MPRAEFCVDVFWVAIGRLVRLAMAAAADVAAQVPVTAQVVSLFFPFSFLFCLFLVFLI